MILTCQCLLSTDFLKWRKRNISQSHPKATWWVVYCHVTGCPPKLCGFIFSQFFFESGIWVAQLGSLALDLCSQDIGWGCSQLGSNGEGSASKITHLVVGRIQLLMAVGLRASVLHELERRQLGSLPSGPSITTWFLASPEWAIEGTGEHMSKPEVSLCNLILEMTSHHSCHLQVKSLDPPHPQGEGITQGLDYQEAGIFHSHVRSCQPQEPQINDTQYRKPRILGKKIQTSLLKCVHIFSLFWAPVSVQDFTP